MMLRQVGIGLTCAIMSALPNRIPGRMRVARTLLDLVAGDGEAVIRRAGLQYRVPSLREPIAVGIVARGVYEPETIDFVLRELPDDGLFVDVGANIGAITLPVANAKPRARILAVEASDRVFAALTWNIRANGLNNVMPVCAFAGENDLGKVPFYEPPARKFGQGSIGPQFHDAPKRVSKRAIDALLVEYDLPIPDVVKIDIEGAEAMALRGMERALTHGQKGPVVLFEFNNWAEDRIPGQNAGDSQRFLLEHGYKLTRADVPEADIPIPQTYSDCMIIARRGS